MAAYGNSCIQVALVDPSTGASSICSAFPLATNGCSGPITVGQGQNGGGNNGSGTTGTSQACSGQPNLVVADPSKLQFGKHFTGTPDFARTITLKNTGSGTCPAVLGTINLSNLSDFALIPSSSGCSNGTALLPNETCTFSLVMKSSSAGAKTTSVNVPYTVSAQSQSPAVFEASSTILADTVVFNPAVSQGSPLNWAFNPTQYVNGQSAATRCSYANSTQQVFFTSVGVSSASEPIYFLVTLSGVYPSGTSVSYFGKRLLPCYPGPSDCSQTWTNFNFSGASTSAPIEVGATAVPVYFKNTSGAIQSNQTASTATANFAYRPKAGPSDAPNKVRTVPVKTYCY